MQRNPMKHPTAFRLLDHPFVKYAAPLERLNHDPEPSVPPAGVIDGVKTLVWNLFFTIIVSGFVFVFDI